MSKNHDQAQPNYIHFLKTALILSCVYIVLNPLLGLKGKEEEWTHSFIGRQEGTVAL